VGRKDLQELDVKDTILALSSVPLKDNIKNRRW